MELPKVRIQHSDVEGGMLINAADFDPAVHKRWEGPEPAPKSPEGTQTTPPQGSAAPSAVSTDETGTGGDAGNGAGTGTGEKPAGDPEKTVRDLIVDSLQGQSYNDLRAQAKAEGLTFEGQPSKETIINALADKLSAGAQG